MIGRAVTWWREERGARLRRDRRGGIPRRGRPPGLFEAVGPFVRAVYAKEMLESLRDRRTLLVMILLPALVVPLATLGIPYLEQRQQRVLRTATRDRKSVV